MENHLSETLVGRYRQRQLSPAERLAVDDHLQACARCRALAGEEAPRLQIAASLLADLEREGVAGAHPADAEWEAFLDGRIAAEQGQEFERHLAGCPRCTAGLRDRRAFLDRMAHFAPHDHSSSVREQQPPRQSERPRRFALILLPAGGLAALAAFGIWSFQSEVTAWRARAASLERENRALRAAAPETPVVPPQVDPAAERLRRENEALRPQLAGARTPPAGGAPAVPPAANPPAGEDGRLPAAVRGVLASGRLTTPSFLATLLGATGTQRGGPTGDAALAPRAPLGTAVLSDRPVFTWSPAPGATRYVVTIVDPAAPGSPRRSERLAGTTWQPDSPLPSDRTYQWEVAAFDGDRELAVAPGPTDPEARFRILSAAEGSTLESQRQDLARRLPYARYRLALGVLYTSAGLIDDAEREFRDLRELDPASEPARRFLDQLATLRGRETPR